MLFDRGFSTGTKGHSTMRKLRLKKFVLPLDGDASIITHLQRFIKEALILKLVRHLNVLRFTSIVDRPCEIYIITPRWSKLRMASTLYLNTGSFTGISGSKSGPTCSNTSDPAQQIQMNILIDKDGRAAIADLATTLLSSASSARAGTARRMSPERFVPDDYDRSTAAPTRQSDVFSFGMLVLECGNAPASSPATQHAQSSVGTCAGVLVAIPR
ncbi:hypothetical protein DFH09DRAFT_1071409 [Mycena vulgaris]|nr:hypothetical protein DFH09DRAFT_1071409 [Mycena vulgaris]